MQPISNECSIKTQYPFILHSSFYLLPVRIGKLPIAWRYFLYHLPIQQEIERKDHE